MGAAAKSMQVREVMMEVAERVEVIRHGDQLILMIDNQPYRLSEALALQFAWELCSKLEQMREQHLGWSGTELAAAV